MKKYILDSCINYIKKYFPQYDKDKLAEIKYGLESIYLSISKAIVVFAIAVILGILKEVIIILLLYNTLRAFAYGLHATKSWICLVSSLLIFIGAPLLAINVIIPTTIKVLIICFSIIIFYLYAPADTKKHPIIKRKKRIFCKCIVIIIACIYSFICLYTNNNFISNAILMALIIEAIFVMPITYKMFKLPYNNYKTYLQLNNI